MKLSKMIIFLIMSALVIAFYWFQKRPSDIRFECSGIAERMAADAVRSGAISYYSKPRIDLYNDTYNSCLHDHGL